MMKKIFALGFAILSFPALANYQQNPETGQPSGAGQVQPQMETQRMPAAAEGVQHMFEFNLDTVLAGALSFDKTKVSGSSADNDTKLNLVFNYAYGIAPLLQVATRFNYLSGVSGGSDVENLNVEFGGILNNQEDFTNAGYVSIFLGAGWAQDFGASTRDDLRFASLAVGKRMSLDRMGLKNVTYTPELAVQMINSTNDSGLDYSQSLEFRFLQFSVFF
jgi:hypothetical protein